MEKSLNININNFIDKRAVYIFDNYLKKIDLFLNCYKMNLPWYYSNWNFLYSSLALTALNYDEKAK